MKEKDIDDLKEKTNVSEPKQTSKLKRLYEILLIFCGISIGAFLGA